MLIGVRCSLYLPGVPCWNWHSAHRLLPRLRRAIPSTSYDRTVFCYLGFGYKKTLLDKKRGYPFSPYLAGGLPAGIGTVPVKACCRGFKGPIPPPLLIRNICNFIYLNVLLWESQMYFPNLGQKMCFHPN